jgi:copper chaperone CopZ
VRVAVEKIPGVDSVRVSLNDGYADIHLAPENTVTVARVRETIRNNGFTPKEARIRVTGSVMQLDDAPALSVAGAQRFRLVEHPDAPEWAGELARLPVGRAVTVEGVVPEAAPGAAVPLTLRVLRLN